MVPIHLSCMDIWGWGSSSKYSVAHNFQAMQPSTGSSHNVAFWKSVWNSPSIPKVNFFTWTLMHHKSLTGEKLSKRGFFGPFRCCFRFQAAETSTHIFVGCVSSHKVWAHFLRGLPIFVPSNSEPRSLFTNWQSRYPGFLSIIHEWRKI